MNGPLSLDDLAREPEQFTCDLHTAGGSPFTARLLRSDDGDRLGLYFDNLGPSVRGMYGPHPLHAAHAALLCGSIDCDQLLPFVAIVNDPDDAESHAIAGYFLVQVGLRDGDRQRYIDHGHPLTEQECCTFAPCIADAWQSRGLGSALFAHLATSLRRLGRRQLVLWGGVRSDNPRAQHFYRKFGFRHVGDFGVKGLNNLDMVLDL
ncbi:MAG TPA: hypothetical protein DIC52_05465 [Candidatus Latescibacteria bacterium]|nr:hypothetical protein [Candidatus Latescibacterota bacterium]